MLEVGSLIEVIDQIDPSIRTQGTIRFIEPDFDIGGEWLYVRANDESLNINQHPMILGGYFTMFNSLQTDRFIDLKAKEL